MTDVSESLTIVRVVAAVVVCMQGLKRKRKREIYATVRGPISVPTASCERCCNGRGEAAYREKGDEAMHDKRYAEERDYRLERLGIGDLIDMTLFWKTNNIYDNELGMLILI